MSEWTGDQRICHLCDGRGSVKLGTKGDRQPCPPCGGHGCFPPPRSAEEFDAVQAHRAKVARADMEAMQAQLNAMRWLTRPTEPKPKLEPAPREPLQTKGPYR